MSERCLSTYVELPEEGYSAAALRRLSDGRRFPSQLGFTRGDVIEIRAATMKRVSISGVQDKLSMRLHRGKLEPAEEGGQYILKPVPGVVLPERVEEVPANESLSMQLAEQVFGITTAANALIRLADGELAYITRRFDRRRDGSKIAQEDFCQLMGRSLESGGKTYKYDASYEELAEALRSFCPAYAIESEKLFRRIVFNYRIGNGDAHLKNFSLHQTKTGDHVMTPAYDLICTTLHIPGESRLALDLFADDELSAGVRAHGFPTGADFLELADRAGLKRHRAEAILEDVSSHDDEAAELTGRSFLSSTSRQQYLEILMDRKRALEIR